MNNEVEFVGGHPGHRPGIHECGALDCGSASAMTAQGSGMTIFFHVFEWPVFDAS